MWTRACLGGGNWRHEQCPLRRWTSGASRAIVRAARLRPSRAGNDAQRASQGCVVGSVGDEPRELLVGLVDELPAFVAVEPLTFLADDVLPRSLTPVEP